MSPCKFCNLRYKWSVTRYLIKFQIYWNGQKGVINEMKIPESLVIKVYGYCYVRGILMMPACTFCFLVL